jgi:hypothetical protein
MTPRLPPAGAGPDFAEDAARAGERALHALHDQGLSEEFALALMEQQTAFVKLQLDFKARHGLLREMLKG